MREGQTPRSAIHIQTFVEVADLLVAALELDVLGALARGPVQAADALARFDDANVVAELAEFVGRDQTRHTGAKDDHLVLGRLTGQLRTALCLAGHQVP